MKDTKTYWEKRAIITENVFFEFMNIVGQQLPGTQYPIDQLTDSWNKALEALEALDEKEEEEKNG